MTALPSWPESPMNRPELLRELLSHSLRFALPGRVEAFDPATQTASVQPLIRERFRGGVFTSLPLLRDVPVFFPGGRDRAMTFPVSPGDECLLIFSDACIDGWFETGEMADPSSVRRHDLSDAFAFVGFRSRPNVLKDFPDRPSFFGGDL